MPYSLRTTQIWHQPPHVSRSSLGRDIPRHGKHWGTHRKIKQNTTGKCFKRSLRAAIQNTSTLQKDILLPSKLSTNRKGICPDCKLRNDCILDQLSPSPEPFCKKHAACFDTGLMIQLRQPATSLLSEPLWVGVRRSRGAL